MPNCDFYASKSDHEQLLCWLFQEATCEVFELASDFEAPLRQFLNPNEILSEFDRTYSNGKKWDTVNLQLYVLGAGPPFLPRRVALNPEKCSGAKFRYAAEGWGLVQLYLAVPREGVLKNSHTNHYSQKRAMAWEPIVDEMQSVGSWDFKKIAAFSSRLNRRIKTMGVAKIGSRAVLPEALQFWDQGASFSPFRREDVVVERAGA